jgi:hypothetical protein
VAVHAEECETRQIDGMPMKICPAAVIPDQRLSAQFKPAAKDSASVEGHRLFAAKSGESVQMGAARPMASAVETKKKTGPKRKFKSRRTKGAAPKAVSQ